MDKRDEAFLEKATKLIDEYKKLESDPRNQFIWETPFSKEFIELRDDMVHLLYSYDPNQPSFANIKKRIECGGDPYREEVLKCIEYTIHYIKEIKI